MKNINSTQRLILVALVMILAISGAGFSSLVVQRAGAAPNVTAGPRSTAPEGTLMKRANLNVMTALEPQPLAFGVCDTAGPIEIESTGGTVVPTAYANLKAAFDAINAGTHTGTITIDVCGDTSEAAAAVLNASGSGSASYTSIQMAPAGGAARTISGSLATPLIDLNGADAVTIDGLNTGGNSLTISNTSTSSTAGTSTIRFIGDASGNTVTNSSILGSATVVVGTAGGNVVFSTGTTTGNDTNTISNNNIGPAGANLPIKLVFGLGTTTSTATENSGVVINNNNLFDFFSPTAAFRAVDVNNGNTDWTISNNRVYQTATRTFTSTTSTIGVGIFVSNTSTTALGNNFQITGNTIGFASAAGTGTMTITGAGTGQVRIYGVHLLCNTSTAPLVTSAITNNTVAGISLNTNASGTTTSAIFMGLYPQTGSISTTGNTVGSMSTTGSISVTSTSATTGDVIGIFNFSSANTTISNNNVGGITVAAASGSQVVYGIRCDLITTVTCTAQNNTIGGTVAGSINNTATGTGTRAVGIITVTGFTNLTGNTVRNLTMSAANTGTTSAASVTGISQTSTQAGHIISQNTIHSLSNTNATAAVTVTGISHSAATTGTTNVAARNLIHSLSIVSTSTTAALRGINVSGGVTTYANNMIRIGVDSAGSGVNGAYDIVGINDSTGTNNYYHNSVYVGGSAGTSATNSFAFQSAVTTNTRNFQNNIFANDRTIAGGGGANFAASYAGTLPNPAGLNANFNVYFSNDSATLLRNATTAYTLGGWRTASGNQDVNSLQASLAQINFINTSGDATAVNLHIQSPTVIESFGTPVAAVTDDFDGQARAGLTPVDVGADALNATGIDVSAPAISYTALSNTSLTTNRVVAATITDVSGIAGGALAPRIYFRKNGAGSYFSTQCVSGGGSLYNCTINNALVGGVVTTDTIQYFVVAQDTVGNVGANPIGGFSATDVNTIGTPPTTPNTYTIVAAFPTSVNVGTGETYTSLTGAGGVFASLNGTALTGNTVVNVTGDLTEDGTNALNALNSDGGPFTLTIQSSAATERLISGAVANGMIRLNGADGVTFQGNVGGSGKFLRFRNTNTSNPTFTFLNDATGNTITSCFVEGVNSSATSGTILFSTSTGTLGNSNNIIRFSDIRDGATAPANAIYSSGSAGAPNGSNTVTDNNIFNFTNGGVLVSATGAGNGWQIKDSGYYQTAARTTAMSFISVLGGSGHTISGNSMGGSTSSAGGANTATTQAIRGIDVLVGTASPTSIQGNTVKNIRSTLAGSFTSSYGIFVQGGTVNVGTVTGNTIGSSNVAERFEVSGDSYGIRVVSTTAVNLSNNTINNMNTAAGVPTGEFYFGIALEGTGGAHSVINNTVMNMFNGSTSDASFDTRMIGLVDTATGVQTIRGNTIDNIGNTSTAVVTSLNNRVWGIVASAVAAGSVVEKNKVTNLYGSSPSTGARVDVITGIQSQGTGSNATYSNNFVALNGGASSDRSVTGILDLATGTNNYYFNSVNIYGTATGANNTYAYNRNSASVVTVRDNIFVNTRTGGTGFNVAHSNTNASATGFTSENNLVNNVDNTHLFQWLGAAVGNNRTLAAWRTDSSQDLLTLQGDPLFTSATDLHLSGITSPAYNAGVAVGGITTDIDGDGRPGSSAFDIGADEIADTTAPDTSIDSNPTNPTSSTSATFTFSGTDSRHVRLVSKPGSGRSPEVVASFECKLDAASFAACTSPVNLMGLTDGSHNFQVRAKDSNNNVDPSPASFTWTIDTTAPDTTIDTNPGAQTGDNTPTFTFSGNDGSGVGNMTFQCQVDAGGFSSCTSPFTTSSLTDGSHTFQVRATDGVGNQDASPASFTFTVDATAPNTTIDTNPSDPSTSADATFTFSGNDGSGVGGLTFQCKLDAASFSSCTSPQNLMGLSAGSHTFQVRATDAVGNTDASPASYTWQINLGPSPVTVTATAGTPGPTGYPTLKAAIDAINAGTHQGAISVAIGSSTTETDTSVLNSNGAGSASYTSISIRPSSDVVTVSGPSATGRGLIELNGADNVTIDGDNPNSAGTGRNLTIQNTAANTVAFTSVIRIALATTIVTSADNVTIKNLALIGSALGRNITGAIGTGTENSVYGILAAGGASTVSQTAAPSAIASTTSTAGTGATASNLTISNNSVDTVARAIAVQGSATTVFPGLLIDNNTIGNPTAGSIHQVYSQGVTVSGSANAVIRANTIYIEGFNEASASTHAIDVGLISTNTSGVTVERNVVARVENNAPSTWPAYGINLGGGNNHVVVNNFVRGISTDQTAGTGGFSTTFGSFGIRLGAGTGHKVYHNSIHMTGAITGTANTLLTAAFAIVGTSVTGCDVRNNIFSNQLTGGNPVGANTRHVAINLPGGATVSMNLTLNNNDYVEGTDPLSRMAQEGTNPGVGEYTAANFDPTQTTPATNFRSYTSTLSAAGTNDNASKKVDPLFVSATDQHIGGTSPMIDAGVDVLVTTDIDGDTRPIGALPDIGADERASAVINADLGITKTDGVSTVTAGGSTTYTITASNAGPSAVTGATVTDTFVAALGTPNWTCVGAGGGTCTAAGSGNISDTVNLPAGGSVTYTVSANISASATGSLVNTATVTEPMGVTDSNQMNNSQTDTDSISLAADLSITKTDGVSTVSPGGSTTYTITASNAGPSNATGATVTDTLPMGISGATWTCVGAGGGTCTAAGMGSISDVVNLPAGGSVTYTLSATISGSASGSVANTATVTEPGGVTDSNQMNNSQTDTDTVAPLPTLSISDARLVEGNAGLTTMTFTVTLSGGSASGVSVHYETADRTARAQVLPPLSPEVQHGDDYVPEQGNIFNTLWRLSPEGDPTAQITISIIGDTFKEPNEFFAVNLDTPVGATIARGTGYGVIVDEDRAYVADVDRDRKTDISLFRPSDRNWYTLSSVSGNPIYQNYGLSTDKPVPGDYDGDGIMDYAVRRPGAQNVWWVLYSGDTSLHSFNWGVDSDLSVQADYDGDDRTDVAVFRNGTWLILRSLGTVIQTEFFGQAGDLPVPGDFDGDGKADLTVFRPSNGTWYSLRSADGSVVAQPWGASGDKPVAGDFDGDGRYDFTVFRNGTWYILRSLSGTQAAEFWGQAGDIPVPGDYDGDGTSDVAVYRPSAGVWYILRSSNRSLLGVAWGVNGDIPIPASYQP